MKYGIACPGCHEDVCCGFDFCNSSAKGNVVREYRYPDGSRGIIMDSGFVNKTPAELQETENNLQRIGWQILIDNLKSRGAL